HGRRGVDEDVVGALDHREGERALEPALGRDQLRQAVLAQRMPQRERALRIGVDDGDALAAGVGLRGELGGERALAGAALAGRERDDVHAATPCLWLRDGGADMVNQRLIWAGPKLPRPSS